MMHHRLLKFGAAFLLCFMAACAAQRADQSNREAQAAAQAATVADMAQQQKLLQERVADLEHQVLVLQSRLQETEPRLQQAAVVTVSPQDDEDSANPSHAVKMPVPHRAKTKVSAKQISKIYDGLYKKYQTGECQNTVMDFEDFIRKYPDSTYSDNAQYWIGECFYRSADYRLAISEFEKVAAIAPKGNKVPDASLRIGMAYAALGKSEQARETYRRVVSSYPNSEAAEKAKKNLQDLTEHGGS